MAQRQYEAATVFNARIADMRHLWDPSREYKGQPTQKPNYFAMFLVKKTVAQWFQEPALAGIAAACGKIYQTNPHVLVWPVIDGDMPSPEGKSSEFAKGHWLFSGSSGNPPNVEIVQAGGVLTKLTNKVGVKSGDYVMAGVTAAVKQNDPRGVKLYLNAVVFSSPGEEIVFANSVSGAELMRMAEQQGLRPAGFSASPGGFVPQPFGAPQQQFGQPGGFTPPAGGFAPTLNAPALSGAQALSGPGFGGPAATPSHFSAPPVNPFGPR
jgi:hypothetical protein